MTRQPANATVAYLGPAGTYSHAAALRWFPDPAACVPVSEIQDVFASVENGNTQFGVVPVENSTEGSITITLDSFIASPLQINAELMLRINHCLLAEKSMVKADISKVVSHQQSLGQCRQWLNVNLPGVERVAVSSNAEAAKIAASQKGAAAIAGRTAAQLYELKILFDSIEDSSDNTTRFLLLGREAQARIDAQYKTSIIISTHNEPGTLFKALEPFQRFGVNLTKLESRPSRKAAWSYSFYVDFDGHITDQKVQTALNELKQHALDVKVLGSYPSAGSE
ncbi:MAG: prephenate dehydratase [Pseudomonadota bacterium]